jgi:hypothetical protein
LGFSVIRVREFDDLHVLLKKIGVEYAYFRHAPEDNWYAHYIHNLDNLIRFGCLYPNLIRFGCLYPRGARMARSKLALSPPSQRRGMRALTLIKKRSKRSS